MTYRRQISIIQQRLLILVSLALTAATLSASPAATIVRDSVATYFRLNSHELDPAYMDNGNRLDTCMQTLAKSPILGFRGVDVVGTASPEGGEELNHKLSDARAKSLLGYISRTILLPDSVVTITPGGRDWSGLRLLVEADRNIPGREELLAVIDSYSDNLADNPADEDECMRKIMHIDNGNAYRYLRENVFPLLRKATVVVEYDRPDAPLISVEEAEGVHLSADMLSLSGAEPEMIPSGQSTGHPFYMALKTNMLYDLAAVPNATLEFYIGRNWSVSAGGMYAWWSQHSRNRYWRIYGGEVEVRRWFGRAAERKPLTGHHVGAYLGALTYDFEWGKRGYMGGLPHGTIFDRCMIVGGVEYGYSLPVSSRLNIDFTIGIGYFGGKYIKYDPVNGKYFEDSEVRLNYFGPTKAEISLVWLLGHGNRNSWK